MAVLRRRIIRAILITCQFNKWREFGQRLQVITSSLALPLLLASDSSWIYSACWRGRRCVLQTSTTADFIYYYGAGPLKRKVVETAACWSIRSFTSYTEDSFNSYQSMYILEQLTVR